MSLVALLVDHSEHRLSAAEHACLQVNIPVLVNGQWKDSDNNAVFALRKSIIEQVEAKNPDALLVIGNITAVIPPVGQNSLITELMRYAERKPNTSIHYILHTCYLRHKRVFSADYGDEVSIENLVAGLNNIPFSNGSSLRVDYVCNRGLQSSDTSHNYYVRRSAQELLGKMRGHSLVSTH